MSSVPPASQLVQLSELEQLSLGSKVRFLGCVVGYSIESGYIYLDYPATSNNEQNSRPTSKATIAELDTALVREELRATDTAIGSWLNVLGYIQKISHLKKGVIGGVSNNGKDTEGTVITTLGHAIRHDSCKVRLQAISLWNAGPIDPDSYNEALKARSQLLGMVKT